MDTRPYQLPEAAPGFFCLNAFSTVTKMRLALSNLLVLLLWAAPQIEPMPRSFLKTAVTL